MHWLSNICNWAFFQIEIPQAGQVPKTKTWADTVTFESGVGQLNSWKMLEVYIIIMIYIMISYIVLLIFDHLRYLDLDLPTIWVCLKMLGIYSQ